MAGHGNTPAAWTAVVIATVAFTVAGVALMLSPMNFTLFGIGMVLTLLALPIFFVLTKMGFGGDRH